MQMDKWHNAKWSVFGAFVFVVVFGCNMSQKTIIYDYLEALRRQEYYSSHYVIAEYSDMVLIDKGWGDSRNSYYQPASYMLTFKIIDGVIPKHNNTNIFGLKCYDYMLEDIGSQQKEVNGLEGDTNEKYKEEYIREFPRSPFSGIKRGDVFKFEFDHDGQLTKAFRYNELRQFLPNSRQSVK
jgi:hypothetical protein